MTLDSTTSVVPEDEAKQTLRRFGIPTPSATLCRDEVAVDAFLVEQGAASYVLKLSLQELTHKSAVGGVRLQVPPTQVAATFAELEVLGRELEPTYGTFHGVLIEPYAGTGTEVALGFHVDPDLGPVAMIGDGGTDVEVTRRVVFGAAPLTPASAADLVGEWSRLPGSAGSSLPANDHRQLADLLVRLAGHHGVAFEECWASIDVNPVIVTADGVVAVDGVLEPASADRTTPAGPAARHPVRGDLAAFLDPASVAVVGASTDPAKPGHALLQNLLDFGYTGSLYPVHPAAETICGLTAYESVSDIPGPVDKVIVLTGRQHVPGVVAECAAKGVKAVHVYSSGFSEWAADAAALEQDTLEALSRSGTRMLGPNCWGAYSPRSRLTTNAARYAGGEPGQVAFVSQSGTHFVDVVRRSNLRSLPLYGALSVGNCLDVQVHEMARHLLDQGDVHVLGLYLEGTAGARELIDVIAETDKPVVVMRGGRTDAGGRAATSHTAALSGDDSVWASLITRAGAVLVETIEDMMDALATLATLPPITGNRLAVFGTGGGVGVAAADLAARNGLVLTEFSPTLSAELAERFGQPGTSMTNPVDVTVWNVFPGGECALSQVLSLIAAPEVADSAIAYLELGSILDLNSSDRAAELVELLVRDLERHVATVPTSFVLRTGGDPESEMWLRDVERRLRGVGIATFSRIQDAVTTHARLSCAAG